MTVQVPNAETVAISELRVDGENPNKMTRQQLDRLKRSIEQYGFIVPIITNKDLVIADGEQRWIAANELAMKEVSVIRLPVEDVDRRLLRQVLNKLRGEHELIADALEFEKILQAGREDDLKYLLDLNDSKLERYLREIHPPRNEDYEIPEIEKVQTDIKRGDILQLGKHRLMCGDSCVAEDVTTLMDGQLANMLFTDPPYGVDYQTKEEYLRTFDKGRYTHGDLANDGIENYKPFCDKWLSNLPLTEYNTIFIWSSTSNLPELLLSFKDAKLYLSSLLIWLKNSIIISRKEYYYQTENIIYGWKGKHKFYGERRSNVFEYDKPNRSLAHPTMKPVGLCMIFLHDGCQPNETVLDLFGGSGSTLIACEQTGRVCYMMEIDPRYCEIIAQRWEKYTGQKRLFVRVEENGPRPDT